MDVEEEYEGNAVSGRKGRLMWEEEAKALKDLYSDMIYGISRDKMYWLGSPGKNNALIQSCYVGGTLEYISQCDVDQDHYGLRPVIKILKSSVE